MRQVKVSHESRLWRWRAEGSAADILGAWSTTADSVSKYKLELQLPSMRVFPLLEVRVGR